MIYPSTYRQQAAALISRAAYATLCRAQDAALEYVRILWEWAPATASAEPLAAAAALESARLAEQRRHLQRALSLPVDGAGAWPTFYRQMAVLLDLRHVTRELEEFNRRLRASGLHSPIRAAHRIYPLCVS